jgi:hypothetical protein
MRKPLSKTISPVDTQIVTHYAIELEIEKPGRPILPPPRAAQHPPYGLYILPIVTVPFASTICRTLPSASPR